MNIKDKIIRTVQIVASVVVVGIPADLMIRGVDSFMGQFVINAMLGKLF
jgi:hypothetical protein